MSVQAINFQLEECIELDSGHNPEFSVIWLHGLGAEAKDFESVVTALNIRSTASVRFIFPNAPYIPVTMNNGHVARAWYDIISASSHSREIDEDSLLAARQGIRQLIDREIVRGIPSHRIFLAGFSQGGALAYFTALTHPEPLAGIIALSTYLPTSQRVYSERTPANQSIPIFAAQGIHDCVVTSEFAYQAITCLTELGYQPEWHTYEMEHAMCVTEIRQISRWLEKQIAPPLR
jgi:phospholipase/carboxylesterase